MIAFPANSATAVAVLTEAMGDLQVLDRQVKALAFGSEEVHEEDALAATAIASSKWLT